MATEMICRNSGNIGWTRIRLSVLSKIQVTRGKQYGDANILHKAIANRFSLVMGIKVTPYMVARLMIELKLARLDVGRYSDDSIYDIINYTALSGQMKNNEENVPIVKPLNKENDPMYNSNQG